MPAKPTRKPYPVKRKSRGEIFDRQVLFGLDRIKELAPQHPEWKEQEPYKSVLAGDIKSAFAGGAKSMVAIVVAGNTNITPDGV
ncbi:MAG TPA: hypothetical protein VJU86_17035 [Pyrinomonadaceae bacterium]|nr:hypothetical protein [Pyrinomonadaceae bacterium]